MRLVLLLIGTPVIIALLALLFAGWLLFARAWSAGQGSHSLGDDIDNEPIELCGHPR